MSERTLATDRLELWIAQHETRGYGKWKILTKDGRLAGRAGVFDEEELDAVELGFTIHPEFQGRGFATEIASAIAAWTFAHFPIARLVAFSHPDNISRQRVLKKIGMTFTHKGGMDDRPWRFYESNTPPSFALAQ
ncbi:MAG: GNAT family N-acetyltransferase [Rhodospirillales bacterium]|nr:GNAT family N-acetyltransferase [Rhodospirillales bacterium]